MPAAPEPPRAEAPNARTVREWGERYSNWGRWGDEDERGTLNFITPERIAAACALPRSGRVVSCALPFDANGPQTGSGGRHNPVHTMLADGRQAHGTSQEAFPGGFRFADDAVSMPLQCGTQWDALSHVFYDGKMYNGRDTALVTDQGAQKNSIDRIADGVVGRALLLDFPRFRRIDRLADGTAIRPEELDDCAEASGVAVEPGDIVLIRTGQMKHHREKGSWRGYLSAPTPGLSVHCARWLYEREVAAVATDTFCVEVLPSETPDCIMPLHMISLRNTGLLLGEMFALDELSDACAADGRYAFLLVAAPLPFTGAVGSPTNPLAIK